MQNIIFLFFRRMRVPLLVLLVIYAVSIGVLVLIPGVDAEGKPWRFDFFHAFYFVSYMASTIGFGEIPYEFSDAQRLWVSVAIYLTVIAWLYAIGTILALVQDPAFKRALTEQRFALSVRRLKEPFYLICGYGETGSLLVRSLDRRHIQSVVIDINPENLNALALEDLSLDVPALCADARESSHLIEGGLLHSCCRGVIAIADVDQVNVKVAIMCKLLRPGLKVICRAETQDTAANLASFNTDHIINPFNIFALHLAMTLRAPSAHLLHHWLVSRPGQPLHPLINPPRGHWIVCGYGRFGKAVYRHLQFEGLHTTIVEQRAEECPEGAVIGRGTEAVTLREAGAEKAAGIVAGTDSDANNLSIIMTARELNPDLYLVVRQNRRSNDLIFEAANLDLVMQGSRIIVWRILPLLTMPILSRFLHLTRHHNEHWGREVLERIRALCGEGTPETWSIDICPQQTEALYKALRQRRDIRLWHLLCDPQDRHRELPCMPLLLVRGEEEKLLPDMQESLQIGDTLLFCAGLGTENRIAWTVGNSNVLEYIETGEERPDGYVWRWLARRRERRGARDQST